MKKDLMRRIENLDHKEAAELAVYAAEQVLHIYEERYPNDDRPRKAIEAAKKCLKDPSKENRFDAYYAADAAVDAAADAACEVDAASAASHDAAYAAVYAATTAYVDAADAADAAVAAASDEKIPLEEKIEKWLEERGK